MTISCQIFFCIDTKLGDHDSNNRNVVCLPTQSGEHVPSRQMYQFLTFRSSIFARVPMVQHLTTTTYGETGRSIFVRQFNCTHLHTESKGLTSTSPDDKQYPLTSIKAHSRRSSFSYRAGHTVGLSLLAP